jgi:hypothetical protein
MPTIPSATDPRITAVEEVLEVREEAKSKRLPVAFEPTDG